jgi:hypothetical protein
MQKDKKPAKRKDKLMLWVKTKRQPKKNEKVLIYSLRFLGVEKVIK